MGVDGERDVDRVGAVRQLRELDQLVAQVVKAVLGLAPRPDPRDRGQVMRRDRRHRILRPLRR